MRPLPRLSCASVLLAACLATACASSPERLQTYSGGLSAPTPVGTTPSPRGQVPVDFNAAALIAPNGDHQKIGNVYSVSGRTYRPVRDDRYDQVGIASWYGPTFHGRPTANGEIFDQHAMTAAHTTLPIPSIAEVTNLENGRSVIVRINDRGPFVDDRIIDLSRAAATELGYASAGLARVRVRYLGPAHANAAAPGRGYRDVAPENAPIHAAAASDTLNAGVGEALSTDRSAEAAAVQAALTLQVGAFSDADNAQRFARRFAGDGDVWVEPGNSDAGPVFRVYFGRWDDRNSADQARTVLAERGVYDARIVAMD